MPEFQVMPEAVKPQLQTTASKAILKTTAPYYPQKKCPDTREKSMEWLKGKWEPGEAHQPFQQGMFEF